MNDDQFIPFKSKLNGDSPNNESMDLNNEELIDFVADLIGNGCSRFKVKTAVEIAFNCKLDITMVTHLMTTARKRIVAQWNRPPAEFRGGILQAIFNDLSNPSCSLKIRTKLIKLLISLSAQLPDELSLQNVDWATKTPAEIAELMDNLTTDKKEKKDS